jgi:ABC-type lipoprotein export system ATPase subunit
MADETQNIISDKTAEPAKTPNVLIKDLHVIYNQGEPNEVRSLENIDLEIFPEEYVIIFGPSGCGKSTLLYSIAGLQKPTSGQIMVEQEDISAYSKKEIAEFHRRKIGMIFQSFYLISSLNILENVCLPKTFAGLQLNKIKASAAELLKRYGILEQANKFPAELSGGEKQRAAVARSLVNNPDIILADEPVGNLDSKSAHVVMTIFKELNEIDKKTIILVTHDPAHLRYGNKIVHMVDGKITKIDLKAKQESSEESYIFKEGKLREDLIKREHLPVDLKLLMRSFRGMSSGQIGNLLIPFKAQQIFYHLFFTMTNDQIDKAIKKIENLLYLKGDSQDFFKELDLPVESGGAGWDKRTAKKFSDNVKRIIEQANKISFIEKEKSARELVDYVDSRLELKLADDKKHELAKVVLDRLENRIGRDEFQKLIDIPEKKDGLGFDRRAAIKIASEIELLLLLRY